MTSVLLLPDPAVLALVDLEVDAATKTITAFAVTTSPQASCPVCGHPAHRVQSKYVRTLADQPCSGQRVRWLVQVRRFWCDNGACRRKIFTERLATCAPAYARRTVQQATILCELAFTLGGKAGERITPLLSMAVSHDTLLRLMKRHGVPTLSTPQVLGVDDFAWKKGRRYGTILIDQETHTVVDLLPDREADTLAKWLKEHPGVKVISRDRAGAYADGARQGAPEAQQVSDRFHLLVNLGDALGRLFERKHENLKQIAVAEHLPAEQTQEFPLLSSEEEAKTAMEKEALALSMLEESSKEVAKTSQALSPTAAQAEARRAKRQNRYEEVIRLSEQGVSQVAIAEMVGLNRDTVRRYIAAPVFPEIVRPKRGSKLDPYKAYLEQRWTQGQHKATQLIEEIRAQGYRGGESIVNEYLKEKRSHPEWMQVYQQCKQRKAQGQSIVPLSARQAAWLFVRNPRKLKFRQVLALESIRLYEDELGKAYHLAQDFRTMVTQRRVGMLEPWLKEVRESAIPELCRLANGIYRDYDAVRAALSTEYSNGQTEAQVHRLKLIKRQAYGRASFDQLRLRVLHGSGVTHQEQLRQDQKKVPNQQKCV
ncbi:MAG: ISL3 family transposase [Ktedonobacteraceae bacterium]